MNTVYIDQNQATRNNVSYDENNLEPGESVAFTYNGKARRGKVVQAPWATKAGSVVCRVECVGEQFPKTFTVDKMNIFPRFQILST